MHAIEQIGAVAGILAFLALALLAFLYFAQARRVRDLEDKATFLPEGLDLAGEGAGAARGGPRPARAAPGAGGGLARAGAAAGGAGAAGAGAATATAASAPPATAEPGTEDAAPATAEGKPGPPATPVEAARRIEAARAQAERRARFEQRRRHPERRPAVGSQAASPREPRSLIVVGLGVAVLAVGIVFLAGRIFGGGSSSTSTPASSSSSAPAAAQGAGGGGSTGKVAVLNGTSTAGLAAKEGLVARNAGFKLGAVTNTDVPFPSTSVMYDQGGQAMAQQVAGKLGIQQVQPMSPDIKRTAAGASVAIVVGQDRAGL